MKTVKHCIECNQPISWGVYLFSHKIYGHAICLTDQCRLEESGATARSVDLYLSLKAKKFPVELQYFDGYKHVDIAIPGKLNIEVSGIFHHSRGQMQRDLSRRVFSLEKNVPSLIIPVSMLEDPESFEHVVNEISKACVNILRRPAVSAVAAQIDSVQMQ